MPKIVSDANLQEFAIKIKGKLSSVATSGSYTDLSNKPTIPTVSQTYSATSTNAMSGKAVASAVSGKQNTLTFDNFPVQNSSNPVTSGGVYTTIANQKHDGAAIATGLYGTNANTTYALPDEADGYEDEILATESYVSSAISGINSEVWTFELEDGTTVTKTVHLG